MSATVRDYAQRYPQHGYCYITALMQRDGHQVNHKRIEVCDGRQGCNSPPKDG